MTEKNHDNVKKVYEIGYLLISSVPKEKVATVVTTLKDVLSKKGAEMIGEEAPELIQLAYTMIKKIGTSNQRFDEGYFGWVKFALSQKEIEDVKKSFESHPDMLRTLVITTVRENTYLGKKAPTAEIVAAPEVVAEVPAEVQGTEPTEEKAVTEDMDKSIDEMVKGA